MSMFCPVCGNTLLPDNSREDIHSLMFTCLTCPYVYNVHSRMACIVPTVRKEVEDVLGGPEAWANVDSTAGMCAAYFRAVIVGCIVIYWRALRLTCS
jgi:DNA-directed RNA polymerase III subunit RPC11